MKTFKQFIDESKNDKGVFKAVFLAGTPGAGKSYTSTKISGGIEPRIVNTDKMLEFIAKKTKSSLDLGGEGHNKVFVDKSKELTKSQLNNYINGMLPLIIDGTSSNINNLVQRVGILEYFGYDVGMIWVDTDFDTAVNRVQERNRKVPEDFIQRVYDSAEENKDYYSSKFDFFMKINNNEGELTDETFAKAYKAAQEFFSSGLKNPIGKRNLKALDEAGESYLVPEQYSKEEISKRIDLWYRK